MTDRSQPVYRLIEADLAGAAGSLLAPGRGRYFDAIEVGVSRNRY